MILFLAGSDVVVGGPETLGMAGIATACLSLTYYVIKQAREERKEEREVRSQEISAGAKISEALQQVLWELRGRK